MAIKNDAYKKSLQRQSWEERKRIHNQKRNKRKSFFSLESNSTTSDEYIWLQAPQYPYNWYKVKKGEPLILVVYEN